MAIQIDLQNSQYGVPFTGAYFRIVTASFTRETIPPYFSIMLDVAGYATKPENDFTKDIDFRRYHVPYAEIEAQVGDNFLSKCYAWVMKQPNMAGSIGV